MKQRTANLLGAVSQFAIDRQLAAIEGVSGLTASSAAALVTISNAPEQRIDFLHRTLGRSQSATTRLVAKLEAQGLVIRAEADDARAVALVLSAEGESLVRKLLASRHDALASFLDFLSAAEQIELDGLLAKMLACAVVDEQHAYQICRLCSADDCDACPMDDALE